MKLIRKDGKWVEDPTRPRKVIVQRRVGNRERDPRECDYVFPTNEERLAHLNWMSSSNTKKDKCGR